MVKMRAVARLQKARAKASRAIDAFFRPDGLDECLRCWVAWMHTTSTAKLGIKTQAGLVGEGDGYGDDVHENQRAREQDIAEATDAMVDSLTVQHRWAIYKSYNLGNVWRFPNANLDEVYLEARQALAEKLKRNICTASLF